MEIDIGTAAPGLVVSCDIGGTKMRTALVSRDGFVSQRFECLTDPDQGIEDATARLLGLIEKSMARQPADSLGGISISTAGPVEPESGIYNHPPNLAAWHGHSMIPTLRESTGLPVVVIHDAHAAAMGEAKFGAAKNARDAVYVTVSTGIGGGMIMNGKPAHGEHGFAGEIGHMIIDPNGPPCNAGCHGCLEVLASGSGIARAARHRLATGDTSSILAMVGGEVSGITSKHVFHAAKAGDALASELVDRAIDALATGLANLLATFDPGALVLGGPVISGDDEVGGMADHWDELLDRTRARSLRRYRNEVPVKQALLGDDVGLVGAAVFIFDQIEKGAF